MIQKIKNLAYKIDASDKTVHVTTLFQVLGGVCVFLYSIYSKAIYAPYIVFAFIIFYFLVIILLIMRSFLACKYGILKLYLNRESGILFDTKAGFRNVSLRAKTIAMMLENVCEKSPGDANKEKVENELYQLGQKVGKNFYNGLVEHLKKREHKFDELTHEDKLNIWADYDSSSGMGKMYIGQLATTPKIKFTIDILNSFTSVSETETYSICKFLSGYIAGFCTELFKKKVIVEEEECGSRAADGLCNFKIHEE